jgi:hypothetical protein
MAFAGPWRLQVHGAEAFPQIAFGRNPVLQPGRFILMQ